METFNIAPCNEIGVIKQQIKDAILDGQIPNEFDAAYLLMLKIADELGLKAVKKN
jgi:hypothetical protein